MKVFLDSKSEASFSKCGLYRWHLKRLLSKRRSKIIFIGLNPSKANSNFDDPTIKRLINFSFSWGYGSLIVINLFARVSCSPRILKLCSDPIGERNDQEIEGFLYQWSQDSSFDLWLGWGNQGTLQKREIDVLRLVQRHSNNRLFQFPCALGPLAIGLTKKGHPRHPLYISQKEVLKPFDLS
ncbi:DUF1643 domain-containing protein [Prochlorococcus sp. MIT 1307]|uniref:DUF1643 domain-containing protein n=1 Tax=Prochlorococcus sp. MIT 1307 TaxID=3096219 RepID=UPI002A751FD2|nr:DUF1643 domain-containing protein [Prochlorococcus sp. MIT 1307]